MSFGEAESLSFLQPLFGKTSVFIFDGRRTNSSFARTLTSHIAGAGVTSVILDLDAFYSSNAEFVLGALASKREKSIIMVPAPGTEVEAQFASLFAVNQRVIVIDSLNSLHHLISLGDGTSRSRKMFFAIRSLSYLAKVNAKAVLLGMYRREGFPGSGTAKSIASLSDVTMTVEIRDDELVAKVLRGKAWSGGKFSSRIP